MSATDESCDRGFLSFLAYVRGENADAQVNDPILMEEDGVDRRAEVNVPRKHERKGVPEKMTDRNNDRGGGDALPLSSSGSICHDDLPIDTFRQTPKKMKSLSQIQMASSSSSLKNMGVSSLSEAYFVLAVGLLLSLNSGYINGLCLSGLLTKEGSFKQSVAVTGSYIKSSLALADGMYDDFVFALSLILAFAGGATVSSLMNPCSIPHRLDPSYGPTFLLGALFLIAAAVAANINPSGRVHYFFAAATNGMQNGMSSMYTANLIRTASHGGTTTDIGLIFGQMLRGNWKSYWKFKVLTGLASSFWVGGFVSFYSATAFAHYSFWFSAGLYMVIGLTHLTFVVLTQKVSFFQATFGTWKWDVILAQMATSMTDTDTLSTMTTEGIDAFFDQIDADGSGKINADELKDALELMGIRLARTHIQAMMSAVDENSDGEVDREEFHAFVCMAIKRSTQKQERHQKRSVKDPPSSSRVTFHMDTSTLNDCEEETKLDLSMRHVLYVVDV